MMLNSHARDHINNILFYISQFCFFYHLKYSLKKKIPGGSDLEIEAFFHLTDLLWANKSGLCPWIQHQTRLHSFLGY